ncbi:dethiobiotin synthase [Halomonas sp. HP20-15]|uniref:dethiobiotin synthase n=1 Tax=Halomonas sp. HP20-15 TaxID=3085901 RepID=UPI002981A464|nr:dethiobiotin synthase [Halomonas sp. HP20-15]MDW5376857.1 dethiobiotin synthase [Halomonas sp. HP20-15]
MNGYFITGTDTDAGKTLVATALLTKARRQGLSTLGLKPVAAGCEWGPDGLCNTDALSLQALTNPPVDYRTVNPVALEPPIAPHLAATQAGMTLRLAELERAVRPALDASRDLILVEGAGGWRVPLSTQEDLSGLAVRLALPVILVVGLRLGCISHARLTLEAIRADGLHVAGWVATQTDADIQEYAANIATLEALLDVPCLGKVPWLGKTTAQSDSLLLAERAADYLVLPGSPKLY